MLDIQYICDNIEAVTKNCQDRGVTVDLSGIVELRKKEVSLIVSSDELKRQHKKSSEKIPTASPDEKPALIAKGKELKQQIATADAELKQVKIDIREIQLVVPNMTHPDAPVSEDESGYVTIKEVGTKPDFGFDVKDLSLIHI